MLFPKEFGGQFSNPQGAQGVPGAGAMESRVPSALASTCCVVGFPPSLPSCQLFRISLSPLLRKWPGLPPQKSPPNAPRKPPRCSLSPLSTRRFCRSPPCIVTVTSPFASPPPSSSLRAGVGCCHVCTPSASHSSWLLCGHVLSKFILNG